uniref:Uncharacterized protein n=1 Tax=Rhizophora mucronata TaxID=61149 RepID=A0A2P2PGV1_RHIMU
MNIFHRLWRLLRSMAPPRPWLPTNKPVYNE